MAASTSDNDIRILTTCLLMSEGEKLDAVLKTITAQQPEVIESCYRATQILTLYSLGCDDKSKLSELLKDTNKFEEFFLNNLTEERIKELQNRTMKEDEEALKTPLSAEIKSEVELKTEVEVKTEAEAEPEVKALAKKDIIIITPAFKIVTLTKLLAIAKAIKEEQLSKETILHKIWEFVDHLSSVIFWLVAALMLPSRVRSIMSPVVGTATEAIIYIFNLHHVKDSGITVVSNAPSMLGHIYATITTARDIVRDSLWTNQSISKQEAEKAIQELDKFEQALKELNIDPAIELHSSSQTVRIVRKYK